MTLTQLQYIITVSEHGNFTQAAEKLNLTQPTLSMQIQKLEESLQVEIFDRKTNPIKVTKIGKTIIEQAKVILQEVKKLEQKVSEEKNNLSGKYTLGIIPTVLPYLVPLFLKNFQKKFPSVQLRIVELKTAEILKQLKSGDLDFGILVTPLKEKEIVEKVLYYEPFLAYVKEGHRLFDKKKLSNKDLDANDMVLLEEGHCFRNNVLSICSNQTERDKSLQIDSGNFDALLNLVKAGYGMTLLPSLYIDELDEKDKKFIKRFEAPEPTREVSMVYHKNQLRISFVNELINLIRAILRGKIYLESSNVSSPLISVPK